MAVIAVVNRKGGSGKSTLATHIASQLAERGQSVMLGDIDRQQSLRLWLKLRPAGRPVILGWAVDERNIMRPPAAAKHVVLDTPAGFQGVGLMKVAQFADAILLPATPSLFDRSAAADCVNEMRALPRVQLGKCRLACVGMRIDGRTHNAALLGAWAADRGLEHLGTIKEAQIYARCMEHGLSIFDLPRNHRTEALRQEWHEVCAWLDEVLARQAATAAAPVSAAGLPRAPSVLPRPSVLSVALARRRAQAGAAGVSATDAVAQARLVEAPAFLRA